MRKAHIVLLLLVTTTVASAQKNTTLEKKLAGLDTSLNRLLKDCKAAGFAVAVIEKNKVVYSKGFGYRDYEAKKPVTPNTIFAIGSSTKAFTCGLLGLLQKDGKLSLDNKVRDYLPDLHFFNDNMDASITVRDLMCHRTGVSRYDYSWYLFNSASHDSLLKRIQYMEPSAGVRQKWQYNNFMFLTQGVIAEKLTGKSWEENIREKFFVPLEMTHSNLSITDLQKEEEASFGYEVKDDSLIRKMDYYHISGMGPAGSINSSVADMSHWVMTWLNGGKYKDKEILPSFYTRDAMSSQMVVDAGFPNKEHPDVHLSTYGLGWFIGSYRGHYLVEHGGNIDGFSANVALYPRDSIGIIVLTNQNSSAVPWLARNIISDRVLGLKYIDWSTERKLSLQKAKADAKEAEKSAVSDKIAGTKPSHAFEDYEGIYSNAAYGDIEIYTKNNALFGRLPADSFFLRHYHYDVFELKGYDKNDGADTSAGGLRVTFRYNDAGKISVLQIPFEPGVKPVEFLYKPKAKNVTKDELTKYTGNYDLPGVVVKVYTKGDVLYVAVPGQPDYETVPVGNHTFTLKVLDGYSVQFEVTGNEVLSVSFIQPNGTFKAKKKP